MSIVVTGATGKLGRLVVEDLLRRGVSPSEIVATGRKTETLDDLADRGVTVSRIDFDDVDTLRKAFSGADKVLLVSGTEIGSRPRQHANAIAAAEDAAVGLIAYTSVANADSTSMLLAADHKATEDRLSRSSVPVVLLRNSWYIENYTEQLGSVLERGVLAGSAGDGRVSAATRADYASAAAAVLTSSGHEGKVYELGGEPAFTLGELAAEISRQSGTNVSYENLAVEAYERVLVEAGVPAPVAAVLADCDRAIASGELFVDSGDLVRLIGRPTTLLADAVAATLR